MIFKDGGKAKMARRVKLGMVELNRRWWKIVVRWAASQLYSGGRQVGEFMRQCSSETDL